MAMHGDSETSPTKLRIVERSDATERRLRGRIGALSLHAQGKTNTGPARASFLARFEREVDPEGVLPLAERARRAEAARRLYFTRLALKSSKTRRRKRRAAE